MERMACRHSRSNVSSKARRFGNVVRTSVFASFAKVSSARRRSSRRKRKNRLNTAETRVVTVKTRTRALCHHGARMSSTERETVRMRGGQVAILVDPGCPHKAARILINEMFSEEAAVRDSA